MSTDYVGNLTEALNHARILLKKGEYALALEQVEEIEKVAPGDDKVIFLKGILHRRLGNHAAAQSLLAELVAKVPQLPAAHQEHGMALFALRRISECKKALRKAVALDKKLADSWGLLGEILARRRSPPAQPGRRPHPACGARRGKHLYGPDRRAHLPRAFGRQGRVRRAPAGTLSCRLS